MNITRCIIPFLNYIDALNQPLKDSLRYYTGEGYDDLNRSFRRGVIMSEKNEKLFNDIMTVMEGGPFVKQPLTLYRGMGYKHKHKDIFQHKGLLSTSYDKEAAKRFAEKNCCLYVITITPGQYTILPLENISESPDEHEILLPPGKLSIQYILPEFADENNEGMDVVYCTYIPDNAEIIDIDKDVKIQKAVKSVTDKLSVESWVERILDNISDEVKLLCDVKDDDDFNECVNDLIDTLPFKQDIPREAIDKVTTLLRNVNDKFK